MGLTLPKTTPGWIYCIREQDYLDQTWGRYVKLGLTARTVEQRIREHQTGNPRRETSEYDIQLELMHYGEKYLHHYFAADRIGGEWFDLDNGQVMADVAPILQTLQSEMAARAADFRAWEDLKNVVSSGIERAPTAAETALHEQFVAAEAEYKITEALHKVHDHNLRAMIGTHDGLEGALTLTEVSGSESLDKTAFIAMLTSAQLALCEETKTSVKGTLSMKGTLTLKAANPAVDDAIKAAKARDLQAGTEQPDRLTPRADTRHQVRAHVVPAKQARHRRWPNGPAFNSKRNWSQRSARTTPSPVSSRGSARRKRRPPSVRNWPRNTSPTSTSPA